MTPSILRKDFQSGLISKEEFILGMAQFHAVPFELSKLLGSSPIEKIEITADSIYYILKASKATFRFGVLDPRSPPIEAINFVEYESYLYRVFSYFFTHYKGRPGHTFDIGANVGWYSVQLGLLDPSEKIIAFEPNPTCFAILEDNLHINKLNNVEAFGLALGKIEGQLFLEGASATTVAGYLSANENSTAVNVTRLDTLCRNRNVFPKIIKADVEGGELDVLMGAQDTLVEYKPICIIEMLRKWSSRFGYHPNDILVYMKRLGYSCFAIGENRIRKIYEVTESTIETNYIYIHDTKVCELNDFLESQII